MLHTTSKIGSKGLQTKCIFLGPGATRLHTFNVFAVHEKRAMQPQRLFSQNSSAYSISKNRLNGKVAVVTASTYGIGFAIAKRLAEEGASVVVSSRNQDNVDKAVDELRKLDLNVLGLKCHVGDAQDRKTLFQETIREYGKINILVSNAAINPAVGGVLDCEERAWDKIFDINVKCSYLLAKEALPHLRKENNSNIVFISSVAGYDTFMFPNLGVYSISKLALIGLTKNTARDLAPEGIRVNCLAPGIIQTSFSQHLFNTEEKKKFAFTKIPLKRLGTTEEIAAVAAFLASDDSSYITGETIVAAGGATGRV